MNRQSPRDLRAFLNFCLETTKNEDPSARQDGPLPTPMTEERQRWLREALASMTVDVIEQLSLSITCLTEEAVVMNDDAANIAEQEEALEVIEDWTENLDLANNFHKLGGFQALKMCLDSPHDSLVTGACNAVAVLAQNNPYCQMHLHEEGFLPILLHRIDHSDNCLTRKKGVYGVSCMTRGYEPAMAEIGETALEIIIRALIHREDKALTIKCAFFLSAAMAESLRIQRQLTAMGLAKHLVNLLDDEHSEASEHLAQCLIVLCAGGNKEAIAEASDPLLRFVNTLNGKIKHVARLNAEEYASEKAAYHELLRILYLENNDLNDGYIPAFEPDR